MLAWSSVAQAGYLLAGVVVGTQLGVRATAFYLAVYLLMNVAAFAVVVARARLGARRRPPVVREPRPRLAAARVADDDRDALARRVPATGGFIGKFYLIDARSPATTHGSESPS